MSCQRELWLHEDAGRGGGLRRCRSSRRCSFRRMFEQLDVLLRLGLLRLWLQCGKPDTHAHTHSRGSCSGATRPQNGPLQVLCKTRTAARYVGGRDEQQVPRKGVPHELVADGRR